MYGCNCGVNIFQRKVWFANALMCFRVLLSGHRLLSLFYCTHARCPCTDGEPRGHIARKRRRRTLGGALASAVPFTYKNCRGFLLYILGYNFVALRANLGPKLKQIHCCRHRLSDAQRHYASANHRVYHQCRRFPRVHAVTLYHVASPLLLSDTLSIR